ncbi:uncharacterized protein LOC122399254 [Colletes gigas]|uniref:uncharacterized protein LOC122399254 n=1 Tax=Colletes gigas TaxID=935657 RepID=UPI001C9ADA1F|nr:uncharacterized protein LOC122399254 [Colletes gigas]
MVYQPRKITEATTTTGTTWLYNITTQGEMSSSGGLGFGVGVGVGVAGGPTLAAAQQGQGVAALLVMLAVLCFIFAYCCWGAPFCRSLCRRHCCCRLEDPEPDSRFGNSDQAMVATPTIILLPHGRMLVVDGTIFTQFQPDPTGLDLVELGDSVLRAQRNPRSINRHQLQNSQGSILEMDAETPSKDSLGSVGCFPPPTYESIYGKEESDMPPSYSDILLHRFANLPHEIDLHSYCHDGKEEIEMQSLDGCPHILGNPMNALAYPYGTTVTNFSSQSFPRRNVTRNPSIISNPLDSYYVDNELELYRMSQDLVPRVFSNANFEALRTYQDGTLFHVANENESQRQGEPLSVNGNHCALDNSVRNNERIRMNSTEEISRDVATGNELMNIRNLARSMSRISQESRNNTENSQRDNHENEAVYVRLSRSEDRSNDQSLQNRCTIANEINRSRTQEDQSSLRSVHFENAQTTDESNRNNECNPTEYYLRNRNNDDASRSQRLETESNYSDEETRNFGALADIRESRV